MLARQEAAGVKLEGRIELLLTLRKLEQKCVSKNLMRTWVKKRCQILDDPGAFARNIRRASAPLRQLGL